MRLVRLDRLERAAAAAEEAAARPVGDVGIVWTSSDGVLEPGELAVGEFVAFDITITDAGGASGTPTLRVAERATRDPRDLGVVYDAAGARLGYVVEVDGTLLSWREDRDGPRLVA